MELGGPSSARPAAGADGRDAAHQGFEPLAIVGVRGWARHGRGAGDSGVARRQSTTLVAGWQQKPFDEFGALARGALRVGDAGNLGVDVTAHDDEDRLLILQCKQYRNPVGSGHVQKFNGTARPHHGADIPIMIALNGFTSRPSISLGSIGSSSWASQR
ncbi:restriction endonuclease [Streptomyces althioticus]|uniref:restriction endonuclease n=1 Tax=Streptomyces althioticus group TaxID=2867194 RepID=UPI001FE0A14B|nr:restriction endonuclease [Streptomyces griseorubens]